MTPQDIATLMRESWFSDLSVERRAAILDHATVHHAVPGARLYRLGDPPSGLFAILEGTMRTVSYTASGMEMVAMVLRPGLWFGELSVLDGKERPHDAIADTPVRVAHLSMSAIAALTTAEPALWRDIALLGCEHQRMAMRHAARFQTQAAIVRLAGFLIGRAASASDGVVRMTQDNLAQVVAVSRQRINALLRDLNARGLVRPVYGGVEVRDLPKLRAFVRTTEDVSGLRLSKSEEIGRNND